MTKEKSQILKGIAILFMIFYHLFNRMNFVDLCTPLFYLDGQPLINLITRSLNPVNLFLILGGYGLYISWSKGNSNRYGRILKLLIHYWMVLLVFVALGHFIRPDKYPGSLSSILINFTTYITSYNGELWFLFPYICLSLLSPLFFSITKKWNGWLVVIATFGVYLASLFVMYRIFNQYPLLNKWFSPVIHIPYFLFNFSLGSLAARFGLFDKFSVFLNNIRKRKFLIHLLIWLSIVGLIASNMFLNNNFLYSFILISLLTIAPFPMWTNKILKRLGNQSMNMWMIHSWFCYHLFSDFIYGLKYPILIFLVLVAISYFLSLFFNYLCLPIERRILTRKEIISKPVI